jgi:D-alanine-D-alanine ligase
MPRLMEINPLAGLHPTHSDLPMLCTALGRDYVELIERIVESARLRCRVSGLRRAQSSRVGCQTSNTDT